MEKCEILIVENGSTDYTNSVALKLIQKYGENVKLIHSEKECQELEMKDWKTPEENGLSLSMQMII